MAQGSAFLTVATTAPLFSQASDAQLDRLHAVPGPAGQSVQMAGMAQINRDSVDAITNRLPVVLGLIGIITFALLFLLTGSVLLPLKALVCNVLSLTAAFGALVWIFQDGHLGALGTTQSGTLVANIPVLLFCVAFGLSMDYEVFLVSRIREYWLTATASRPATADNKTKRADNDESVALGLARTGRVVTAAALVMSISFAALIAAQVSFMRMFGLGLTLAVLVDATLVRMVLVPAFMHVLGRWSWWAPKPLMWLHERFGISEAGSGAAAGGCRRRRRAAPSTRRGPRPALPWPHLLPRRSPMVVSPPTDSLRRRRAPRGSGDLLRDEILDAATELLLDTGHAKAVSIRSVAERVGVTPPSIYLHFQDKDALLDAVCARYFEKLDEEMQRVSAVQSSTVEVLRAQGLAYVRFATENPELYRIATMGEWRSGSNVDSALASSAFEHMCAAVGVLMDEGVFPRGDAAAVALELWSAAHGAASLLIAKPHLPFGDAEAFTDRVLRAVFLGHLVAGLVGVDATPDQVVEQLTALKSSVRGSS